MNYKTSKGLKLAWLAKYDTYVSGRVRVESDDPSCDVIVRWRNDMQPINHDYGVLQRVDGVSNQDVDGFNIFRGLR